MMMDPFTKNALWDYWNKGDDQEVLTDETYQEYKNEWFYKLNNDVPWDPEEPWKPNDHGIDNFENDLVRDNSPYHANKKEEQYEEDRCYQSLANTKKIGFELLESHQELLGPAEKYIAIKQCEHDD
ncbi:hypothetical protein Tco_1153494 [Tanacetum coccineum]